MIIKFLRFLLGYVKFSIWGEFPERFFNQLAINGVSVWGMTRNGDKISAYMSAKDYLNLPTYRSKNRVRSKVLMRFGLPFTVKKHRYRIGTLAGVLFFFSFLFFMSNFIWNIEVVGTKTINPAQITAACKELGLYEGAKTSSLDPEIIRTKLMLKFDNIAWASVNIEGVKATVNVSESIGDKKPAKAPCNLIATSDGIITAIEVTEGSVAVKLGQTVSAGDLLVSGITEYKDQTAKFGPSSGKVFATTSKTLTYLATFTQTETIYKGEPETKRVLSFFGVDIPLYLGSINGHFEVEQQVKKVKKNGMYLPITLTETTFKETDIRAYEIDEQTATVLAEEKLKELEGTELKDAEILSREITFESTEKGVRIIGNYTLRENIATEDFLLIYEEK